MRKVLIMLLFSVVAVGQTYECTLEANGVQGPCQLVDRSRSAWRDVDISELQAKIDKMDQRVALQFKVLGQFSLMELELKQLNDKRVNRVINRHLAEIEKLVVQMKQLDEAK